MEYGIHALAGLAGVSARTLRYYDQIGLLRPSGTTEAGYRLAQQQGVSMPITEAMYEVLYNGLSAKEAIRMLLGRPRRGEHEEVWFH